MTFVINEAGFRALTESQEGLFGRYVERIADAVVVQAQLQFDEYFHGVLPAGQDIISRMDGSTATVGYSASAGNKSRRLAAAEAAGKLTNPPIAEALERVRGGN